MSSVCDKFDEVGFDSDDYRGVAKNITRVLKIHRSHFESFRKETDFNFPKLASIRDDVANSISREDRFFFSNYELDYASGVNLSYIKAAFDDYFLRKKGLRF
jgi:hypothetical protein